MTSPLLEARGLRKAFRAGSVPRRASRKTHALRGVDLTVAPSETVGIVGESGSGKSTLVRCLLRLIEPDSGSLSLEGEEYTRARPAAMRALRSRMQMVFQDPYGSLDSRWTIERILEEPMRVHGELPREQRRARAQELLASVGLDAPGLLERHPDGFSGGQRQRIAIARAIAMHPSLVVLDEAVSALDVVTQAEVLNLLAELQASYTLAYVFISHDLAVVSNVADRVVVLYSGIVVEEGPTAAVVTNPLHPYTQALIASIPGRRGESDIADRRERACDSERGPDVTTGCWSEAVPLVEAAPGHFVRCAHLDRVPLGDRPRDEEQTDAS